LEIPRGYWHGVFADNGRFGALLAHLSTFQNLVMGMLGGCCGFLARQSSFPHLQVGGQALPVHSG